MARRSTVVLVVAVCLLAFALVTLLGALTHLDHIDNDDDDDNGRDDEGTNKNSHHGDLDAAARMILRPIVGKRKPASEPQQWQLPPSTTATKSKLLQQHGDVDTTGIIVRGGGDAVRALTQAFALLPIESAVAPRIIHVDYGKEVRSRLAEYPAHTFVFAMHVSYPPFLMPWPNFLHDSDLQEFKRKEYTGKMLAETATFCSSPEAKADDLAQSLCARRTGSEYIYGGHSHVDGSVEILANVSFSPHECGWMTTPKNASPLNEGEKPDYDKVAFLDVPEGCSFQHFFDGVVPKMVQAMPLLSDEDIKLVLPGCAPYPMVTEFLRYFGISESRVIRPSSRMSARLYYSFCDAPGWHPILWQQMQQIIRADTSVPLSQRKKIVYLQRNKGTHNGGRTVSNEAELISAIQRAAPGYEVISFDSASYPTPEDTRAFFKDVRALVGPHGGAFYNMMWCGSDTAMIEFVPSRTHFFLFAQMANMLHQHHWFMAMPENGNINVDDVQTILQKELAIR